MGRWRRDQNKCLHGHKLDEAGVYIDPGGNKQCRVCRLNWNRKRPRKNLCKCGKSKNSESRVCKECHRKNSNTTPAQKSRYPQTRSRNAQARLREFMVEHQKVMLVPGPLWDAYHEKVFGIADRWQWKLNIARGLVEGNGKK